MNSSMTIFFSTTYGSKTIFFLPYTPRQSLQNMTSEDSSMVEESPGSFQLYTDWKMSSMKPPQPGRNCQL